MVGYKKNVLISSTSSVAYSICHLLPRCFANDSNDSWFSTPGLISFVRRLRNFCREVFLMFFTEKFGMFLRWRYDGWTICSSSGDNDEGVAVRLS